MQGGYGELKTLHVLSIFSFLICRTKLSWPAWVQKFLWVRFTRNQSKRIMWEVALLTLPEPCFQKVQ
jgi:hypothetical protein